MSFFGEPIKITGNRHFALHRWRAWRALVGRLHEACQQPLQEIDIDDAALMASFPKYRALCDFLRSRCEQHPEFHGMVFVRTRLVSGPGSALRCGSGPGTLSCGSWLLN